MALVKSAAGDLTPDNRVPGQKPYSGTPLEDTPPAPGLQTSEGIDINSENFASQKGLQNPPPVDTQVNLAAPEGASAAVYSGGSLPSNPGRAPSSDFLGVEYYHKIQTSLVRGISLLEVLVHQIGTFRSLERSQLVETLKKLVDITSNSLSLVGLELKLLDIVCNNPVAWVDLPESRIYFESLSDLARYLCCTAGNVNQRKSDLLRERETNPNVWSKLIKGVDVRFTEYGLYGSLPRGPRKTGGSR